MDRRREMGYWWEQQKEKMKPQVKIGDLECIECGRKIPRETLTAHEFELFFTHGVHCKNCMDKKLQTSWGN